VADLDVSFVEPSVEVEMGERQTPLRSHPRSDHPSGPDLAKIQGYWRVICSVRQDRNP